MDFDIQIKKFDCIPIMDNLTNVIIKIYWSLTGKISQKMHSINIITTLSVDYTNSSNFIEYSNLTQDVINGWLLSVNGEKTMNDYKQLIYRFFEENIESSIVNPKFPWE